MDGAANPQRHQTDQHIILARFGHCMARWKNWLLRLEENLMRSLCFSSAEAKSDLVNVLSRLEAHWVVLEAEMVEINKDITYCEQCVQKYGYSLTHLLKPSQLGRIAA